MIVPHSRFLFWFAVIVLPFTALAALYPEAQALAGVLIAGLLMVAAVDASLALSRLQGISVELPLILRLSRERTALVEIILKNPQQGPLALRVALGAPASLGAEFEEQSVQLPAGHEASRIHWRFTPVRRGRFAISRAYLECLSRVGFWAIRRTVPVQCEVRVYPNLSRERKSLAALFLNRGSFGIHAQRQLGKGRDFEKLREYIPGDGFDEIHWKATAKRSHPVTKVYQIERTQEVYIVLDASRLSSRKLPGAPATTATPPTSPGSAPALEEQTTTLERFISSALILAQAAEKQGDLFGLITFTDQADTFLRARNGQHHYAACRDALYTLEARNVTPDFDEIASFIRTRLRRRALLMFLTSLDDPMLAENFARNMALLAGQHLVMVNMIQPAGVAPVFTNGEVAVLDDLYRHLGGHLQWNRLQELQKVLKHRGVRFSLLANERMSTELVSQYLSVKQRQLI